MEINHHQADEAVSPAGRLFLQPELNQVINCVIAGPMPIDVNGVKAEVANSVILHQHPRFNSLFVRDSRGKEHWRRTKIDIDQHLIIRHEPLSTVNDDSSVSDEDIINDYLAELAVSSPLSLDKPLWEIHILVAHKCVIFRIHHALGDGISLMSMFLSVCRRADDSTRRPTIEGLGSSGSVIRRQWSLVEVIKTMWYTVVFLVEFVMRSLWLKDKNTVLSGGDGVELWPRKLATAKFMIDDMKVVKKAVHNTTINDVLFGVISLGLSKYIDLRSPKVVKKGLQITGIAMVNLRPKTGLQDMDGLMENKSRSGWGNKFGMILLPVYYHKVGDGSLLHYVKRAKGMIDKKKLSLDPLLSYKIGDLIMSCFGTKLASTLNYKVLCGTTFTISNIVGSREKMTIAGKPIAYMRVNSTSLPHAITMHMVSYAGRADMQILVAKDIIPDPKILAKCFDDALLELKEVAMAAI